MPIFEDKTEEVEIPPQETIQHRIEPAPYDGITINTKYVPSSSLISFAQGSNWTVDYFSQVLGRSTEPTELALDRDKVYQSYRQIKGMVLKVSNPLTHGNESLNLQTAEGSGYTFPFLIPNKGDMFIADIGDGTAGLFTISSATRATLLRDSVYNVTWQLVSRLTPQQHENLNFKTVQTLYYNHASMANGCGPFVTLEETERREQYGKYFYEILKRYLTDFFSVEHSTLLVPDQQLKTYDHFVTKMFLTMISSADNERVRRIRELNVQGAAVMKVPTLWTAILHRDAACLYGSTERAHLVTTRELKGSPLLQAIGYTGIDRMVYPLDAPVDVDSQYDRRNVFTPLGVGYSEGRPRRPLPGPYVLQRDRDYDFFKPLPDLQEVDDEGLRPADIHPVIIDRYYVFSEMFYKQYPGQSKLELLTRQLVENKELNLKALDYLLKSVYDWDNLERYYYHPVVLALLRHAMG